MTALDSLADCIPALRRYARVLSRDPREADDLVQDVLLRAVDRLQSRLEIGNMKGWLFAIMHNTFVSRWRKAQSRGREISLDAEDYLQPSEPPAQEGALQMRDLMRSFDLLPEEQRQVLLLVAVEGLSYAEVAAVLGVPIGTVMSRLSRGRERLRQMMDGTERPGVRPDARPDARPDLRPGDGRPGDGRHGDGRGPDGRPDLRRVK
jgi:RNA polymerase sigma-70 factor (ECF subfamily)